MDNVNHPAHYEKNSLTITFEPFDWLQGFSFTLGNALKYLVRYQDKNNPKEDLEKAKWYLQHLDYNICHRTSNNIFDTIFPSLAEKYEWLNILYPDGVENSYYLDRENVESLIVYIDETIATFKEPEKKKEAVRDKEYYLSKAKDLVYETSNSIISEIKKLNESLKAKNLVDDEHDLGSFIYDIDSRTSEVIVELNYLINNKNAEPETELSFALSKYIFTVNVTVKAIKRYFLNNSDTNNYEFITTFSQEQLGHKFINLFSKAYPDIDFQSKTISLDEM